MSEQSGELFIEDGIPLAPQSASCLLFIAEHGDVSAANIAAALNLPHQVVAQRLTAMLDLKLIMRRPDPQDGRRKIIRLTPRGRKQFERLKAILREADAVFDQLNAELGIDFSELALRLIDSLDREPLAERILKRRSAQKKKAG
ncbi:MAG: MarR family transcriptional regulator [Hyphococcus sp.]